VEHATTINEIKFRSDGISRGLYAAISLAIIAISLLGAGCVGDCGDSLPVRGRLVDAVSGQAVSGASVGGRTITDGSETNFLPYGRRSNGDGSFVLVFSSLVPCHPSPMFRKPDQLEINVLRDGCEQQATLLIEIDADSAQFVDGGDFSVNALELTDPILVPPCEESP
jgi:hypothetical protein